MSLINELKISLTGTIETDKKDEWTNPILAEKSVFFTVSRDQSDKTEVFITMDKIKVLVSIDQLLKIANTLKIYTE